MNRRALPPLLLLAAACTTTTDKPKVVEVGDAAIHVVGRFDAPAEDAVRFAWSLTTIEARFTGPSLAMDVEEQSPDGDTNRFAVFVDGRAPVLVKPPPGRSVVPLVDGLDDGEHVVRVVRLTEPMVGATTLHGLVVAEGHALLEPPPPKQRRIEVLGDSLTAGYGNLGSDAQCPFSADTEDALQAWAGLAARDLDADAVVLAWSGKGVVRNYDPGDRTTLPMLWGRAVPTDEVPWTFDDPQPDVVLVHLGTNDFAQGVPDEEAFVAAYGALLDDVRARRPAAKLVLVVPPLTDEWPPGEQHGSTMRRFMDRIAGSRDDVDLVVAFTPPTADEGLGCAWHPTVATHRRWAALVVEELRPLLGW